jgi:hypothetical protein
MKKTIFLFLISFVVFYTIAFAAETVNISERILT